MSATGGGTGHAVSQSTTPEYTLTTQVPPEDDPLLSNLLNSVWGSFYVASPAVLRGRFTSGQLFVLARVPGTVAELAYIRSTYGLEPAGGIIPVSLLETMAVRTGGDPTRVPPGYGALTGGGLWRPVAPDADTLVLVDLTTAVSRRGEGVAARVLREGLRIRRPELRHVFTFSPRDPDVIAWHTRRGARPTGHVITGARPGYPIPDVMLMDYSHVAV